MSLNDPQWGKRGSSGGPPDLDEIWRNVNRRLNEVFRRKGSPGDEQPGGNGGGSGRPLLPLSGAGILIAHRTSTVREADQIVVLKDGELIERGTHDELLAQQGYYADLYQKQLLEEELERA